VLSKILIALVAIFAVAGSAVLITNYAVQGEPAYVPKLVFSLDLSPIGEEPVVLAEIKGKKIKPPFPESVSFTDLPKELKANIANNSPFTPVISVITVFTPTSGEGAPALVSLPPIIFETIPASEFAGGEAELVLPLPEELSASEIVVPVPESVFAAAAVPEAEPLVEPEPQYTKGILDFLKGIGAKIGGLFKKDIIGENWQVYNRLSDGFSIYIPVKKNLDNVSFTIYLDLNDDGRFDEEELIINKTFTFTERGVLNGFLSPKIIDSDLRQVRGKAVLQDRNNRLVSEEEGFASVQISERHQKRLGRYQNECPPGNICGRGGLAQAGAPTPAPEPPKKGGDVNIHRRGVPDIQQTENECVGAATANSLIWLAKEHKFEDKLPGDEQELIDDILESMGGDRKSGVKSKEKFLEGKMILTEEKKLPLVNKLFDTDAAVKEGASDYGKWLWEKIVSEMEDGEDVELVFRMTDGKGKTIGAHAVTVVGANNTDGKKNVVVHDPDSDTLEPAAETYTITDDGEITPATYGKDFIMYIVSESYKEQEPQHIEGEGDRFFFIDESGPIRPAFGPHPVTSGPFTYFDYMPPQFLTRPPVTERSLIPVPGAQGYYYGPLSERYYYEESDGRLSIVTGPPSRSVKTLIEVIRIERDILGIFTLPPFPEVGEMVLPTPLETVPPGKLPPPQKVGPPQFRIRDLVIPFSFKKQTNLETGETNLLVRLKSTFISPPGQQAPVIGDIKITDATFVLNHLVIGDKNKIQDLPESGEGEITINEAWWGHEYGWRPGPLLEPTARATFYQIEKIDTPVLNGVPGTLGISDATFDASIFPPANISVRIESAKIKLPVAGELNLTKPITIRFSTTPPAKPLLQTISKAIKNIVDKGLQVVGLKASPEEKFAKEIIEKGYRNYEAVPKGLYEINNLISERPGEDYQNVQDAMRAASNEDFGELRRLLRKLKPYASDKVLEDIEVWINVKENQLPVLSTQLVDLEPVPYGVFKLAKDPDLTPLVERTIEAAKERDYLPVLDALIAMETALQNKPDLFRRYFDDVRSWLDARTTITTCGSPNTGEFLSITFAECDALRRVDDYVTLDIPSSCAPQPFHVPLSELESNLPPPPPGPLIPERFRDHIKATSEYLEPIATKVKKGDPLNQENLVRAVFQSGVTDYIYTPDVYVCLHFASDLYLYLSEIWPGRISYTAYYIAHGGAYHAIIDAKLDNGDVLFVEPQTGQVYVHFDDQPAVPEAGKPPLWSGQGWSPISPGAWVTHHSYDHATIRGWIDGWDPNFHKVERQSKKQKIVYAPTIQFDPLHNIIRSEAAGEITVTFIELPKPEIVPAPSRAEQFLRDTIQRVIDVVLPEEIAEKVRPEVMPGVDRVAVRITLPPRQEKPVADEVAVTLQDLRLRLDIASERLKELEKQVQETLKPIVPNGVRREVAQQYVIYAPTTTEKDSEYTMTAICISGNGACALNAEYVSGTGVITKEKIGEIKGSATLKLFIPVGQVAVRLSLWRNGQKVYEHPNFITVKVGPTATVPTATTAAALSITTSSPLPSGTLDVAYSTTLAATGGTTPYTWSITRGNLPDGLSLNSSTGVISGTPTSTGLSIFDVTVTDANNNTNTKEFRLTINS
jgi:hypothetical protein